jgi:hypothetical protein
LSFLISPILCFDRVGPEVEARIASFRAANGPVLFGGRLASEVDPTFAIPDSLGLYLDEPKGETDAAKVP